MSDRFDVGERLRAARPTIQGEAPPFEAVFARIAAANTGGGAAGRPRRRRIALLVALGALALAAAAWGAASVLSGSAVAPDAVAATPTLGWGLPVPSSLSVLPLRATDPAGGPPWAMRLIRTTRGLGCVQVGRLVSGELGALAIDRYAFHGDGLLHPFLATDSIDQTCVPLDANGRVFTPRGAQIVTADGLPLVGNVGPAERVHCDLPGSHDWAVRCPQSVLRDVEVGFLGPDAVRISVREPGRAFTIAPYGRDGAYLLVLPAPPHANTGSYGAPGWSAPGTPVLTVTFRDGSTCRIPNASAHDTCVAKGLVAVRIPAPTTAQARARVHVRYLRRLGGAPPPLVSVGSGYQTPPGFTQTRSALVMPPGPALVITFTARVASPDLFSDYNVELRRAVVPGCFGGSVVLGRGTGTIRPGQTVSLPIRLQPACHGVYTGRVYYASTPETFNQGVPDLAYPMLPPFWPHLHVVTVAHFRVTVP